MDAVMRSNETEATNRDERKKKKAWQSMKESKLVEK